MDFTKPSDTDRGPSLAGRNNSASEIDYIEPNNQVEGVEAIERGGEADKVEEEVNTVPRKRDVPPKSKLIQEADGSLWYRHNSGILQEVVFHEDIFDELLRDCDVDGKYDHDRSKGREHGDRTSFLPSQQTWGSGIDERPEILFTILRHPDAYKHRPATSWMSWDHCIVVDNEGQPVRHFEELPCTISSMIEGWWLEAIGRFNPAITDRDVLARMFRITPLPDTIRPNGSILKAFGQPSRNTLNMRRVHYREKTSTISWIQNNLSDPNKRAILGAMEDKFLEVNSTRGRGDVTLAKSRKITLAKPNKDGAVARALNIVHRVIGLPEIEEPTEDETSGPVLATEDNTPHPRLGAEDMTTQLDLGTEGQTQQAQDGTDPIERCPLRPRFLDNNSEGAREMIAREQQRVQMSNAYSAYLESTTNFGVNGDFGMISWDGMTPAYNQALAPGQGLFQHQAFASGQDLFQDQGVAYGQGPSYGQGLVFGQAPSYGQGVAYGQAPFQNQGSAYGQAPFQNQGSAYGQVPSHNPTPFGQQTLSHARAPSYGQTSSFGQGPSYGQPPSYGQTPSYFPAPPNGQGSSYGQAPFYDQAPPNYQP